MQPQGIFEKLWEDKTFTSKIITIIYDEAHCISRWGSFCPEYKDVGQLRHFLPMIPVYATTATFSPKVRKDVGDILHLQKDNTKYFLRSNDQPNVYLSVRAIINPIKTYKDLAFLVPDKWTPGQKYPPKFLVFFNNIKESENAARFLRSRLPRDQRHLINWYHATMSDQF